MIDIKSNVKRQPGTMTRYQQSRRPCPPIPCGQTQTDSTPQSPRSMGMPAIILMVTRVLGNRPVEYTMGPVSVARVIGQQRQNYCVKRWHCV